MAKSIPAPLGAAIDNSAAVDPIPSPAFEKQAVTPDMHLPSAPKDNISAWANQNGLNHLNFMMAFSSRGQRTQGHAPCEVVERVQRSHVGRAVGIGRADIGDLVA